MGSSGVGSGGENGTADSAFKLYGVLSREPVYDSAAHERENPVARPAGPRGLGGADCAGMRMR